MFISELESLICFLCQAVQSKCQLVWQRSLSLSLSLSFFFPFALAPTTAVFSSYKERHTERERERTTTRAKCVVSAYFVSLWLRRKRRETMHKRKREEDTEKERERELGREGEREREWTERCLSLLLTTWIITLPREFISCAQIRLGNWMDGQRGERTFSLSLFSSIAPCQWWISVSDFTNKSWLQQMDPCTPSLQFGTSFSEEAKNSIQVSSVHHCSSSCTCTAGVLFSFSFFFFFSPPPPSLIPERRMKRAFTIHCLFYNCILHAVSIVRVTESSDWVVSGAGNTASLTLTFSPFSLWLSRRPFSRQDIQSKRELSLQQGMIHSYGISMDSTMEKVKMRLMHHWCAICATRCIPNVACEERANGQD